MAIRGRNVKQMWKESGGRLGAFSSKFRHLLGIREDPQTGRRYVDQSAKQVGTDEFRLRDLTEAFLGHSFIGELADGPPASSHAEALAYSLSNGFKTRMLMEDVAPVTPSIFQDISAWNASIAGLVEVRLLEGYNQPKFIGDEFCEVQPTRVNGGKMIGIPYPAPKHEVTAPGIEFPTIGMNQLYVWARPNMVIGGKLALDRNTVVYDLSGELMGQAESIGKGLGLEREYVIGCNVLGVAPLSSAMGIPQSVLNQLGDSFRMSTPGLDATPNPTYQTTSAGLSAKGTQTPNAYTYVNEQTGSNSFQDWTDLNKVRKLLNLMRDPVLNLPFDADIVRIWVDPFIYDNAKRVQHATQVINVTGNPAAAYGPLNQGAGSTVPPVLTGGPGFPTGSQLSQWDLHTSNIWHQILLDAGISEANAEKYFLCGNPKKAFVWRSAWDMRVDQANPSSSELLGRNIVNEWVTQLSGQFVVREPRYVVLTTN